jgi:chromate transporter
MTIHLGYLRAGWPGLVAGGVSFVLPATLIVLCLAWAYVRYGSTPAAGWLLYGVKPVVIALIVHALWDLGRKGIRDGLTAAAGLVVLVLSLLGVNEIALLFGGGLIVMMVANRGRLRPGGVTGLIPLLGVGLPVVSAAAFSLPILFLTCLKIGSILYGSGYVLLAFLRADFVTRLGWLTDQQLLDAIAVGQVTPGPLFTSATFIGYVLGGIPGAVLGTLGLLLPSFVFVALSHPLIPRMRASPWLGSLLDGVIAASLGLMAAVTLQIARASLVDIPTILLALVSAVALVRLRLNSTWLVVGGALAGLAIRSLIQ